MMNGRGLVCGLAALALVGCATSYGWRPTVPESARTIACPTFHNASDVSEAGSIAARQMLREIQREGTFKIRPVGDAALEIQGEVTSIASAATAYDRRGGLRVSAQEVTAKCKISIIDKRQGKVLVNNRLYDATTTTTANQDTTTTVHDATGRVMEDLARQVVDDLRRLRFDTEEK